MLNFNFNLSNILPSYHTSNLYDYSYIEEWFSNLTDVEQKLIKSLVRGKNKFVKYDNNIKLDTQLYVIDGCMCCLSFDMYKSIKKHKRKLKFLYQET